MNSSKLFLISIFVIFSTKITCQINEKDFNYLFVHGLGGDHNQVIPYANYKIIKKEIHCNSFNGPEVSKSIFQSCLAQEGDIEVVVNGIKTNKSKIIGVGVSKGAATLINTASSGKLENIVALVLESPFADVTETLINHKIISSLGLKTLLSGKTLTKWLFPNYNPEGIQPIKVVNKISKNIPIIIFHSKKDSLININHARKLYLELIKDNRDNVHLVETENGNHANVIWHHSNENLFVINVIHEFYKKYDLPYYPDKIKNIDLKKFKPTSKEVETLLR